MISSRTPEGEHARCPLCGQDISIAPSQFFGDAPCPICGQLLWFIRLPTGIRLYDSLAGAIKRERLKRILAGQLGVDPEKHDLEDLANDFEGDSLELIELVMGLEDEDFDTQ